MNAKVDNATDFHRQSVRGEPAWEIATLYPIQGTWAALHVYSPLHFYSMACTFNRLFTFTQWSRLLLPSSRRYRSWRTCNELPGSDSFTLFAWRA